MRTFPFTSPVSRATPTAASVAPRGDRSRRTPFFWKRDGFVLPLYQHVTLNSQLPGHLSHCVRTFIALKHFHI